MDVFKFKMADNNAIMPHLYLGGGKGGGERTLS